MINKIIEFLKKPSIRLILPIIGIVFIIVSSILLLWHGNANSNQSMVAYLETNKESNVGLYQHYGFELKRKECVPKTDVMHYAMVRKPIDKNNQI